ncbi:MAG TPA: cytochrome c oxidase subunit II transmembrane domain-containing protein, partial [Parvularculaceae bacterium]|nr:cytochrome c oxidase subunit II transmembrane domain-containing protein [Parvularculaceae bacterium]
MRKLIAGSAVAGLAAAIASLGVAGAEDGYRPVDGGFEMLAAGSKLAEEVHFFHNIILMPIITVISLFVLALLLYVMARYNSKANPTPRKFSHNTLVEIVWTGVPILILVSIALPSFDLLFKEDVMPDGKQVVMTADGASNVFSVDNDFPPSRMAAAGRHVQVFRANASGVAGLAQGKDYQLSGLGEPKVSVTMTETPAAGDRILVRLGRSLVGAPNGPREIALAPTVTLKAIGYQWGWTYSYPDFGDFEFSSNMAPEGTVPDDVYRFEVDNRVVVPVGETIRVVTTARDVIHAGRCRIWRSRSTPCRDASTRPGSRP